MRNGEGIQLQVLSVNGDQIAVIAWYTYDENGKPIWVTGIGVIEGDIIRFDDAYTTAGGAFGSALDSAAIQVVPFGDLQVDFDTCEALTFSYDATASARGSGSYSYIRLSELAGTTCTD